MRKKQPAEARMESKCSASIARVNQALAILDKAGATASVEWNLHKGLGLIASALAQDIPAMKKRLAEIDSDVKSIR
jgi:hypothetical protein